LVNLIVQLLSKWCQYIAYLVLLYFSKFVFYLNLSRIDSRVALF